MAYAQGTPVAVVSAASYERIVAPDSIASAFGVGLATTTLINTPGQPLPTQLGGTILEIDGRRAPLFFVSPNQINFLVPAETAMGTVNVVVQVGGRPVASGTVTVESVRPAIFTADGSGQGLPVGQLLRVQADGTQILETLTTPILFGPANEQLFLILYLTGIRGAPDLNNDGNVNETIRLSLGGDDIVPLYAGKQGGLVGLDQLNVELPRKLIGRGTISLRVTYLAQAASNLARIEIGGVPLPTLRIDNLTPTRVLAGEELVINGTGFSANANENEVFIVDDQAQGFRAKIKSATPTQLRVTVPFGAGSGVVHVHTPNGVAAGSRLTIRTSISGFVETTTGSPIPRVVVRLRGTNLSSTTNSEGAFILPDAPTALVSFVEIDSSLVQVTLPFPTVSIKVRVNDGRDNHLERRALQQASGPIATTGQAGTLTFSSATDAAPGARIERDGVAFETADGTTATFPNGTTSGEITLTVLNNGNAPVRLPPGIFSRTIAQLTPFGVKLTPGGTLTFPNRDNLPAGAQVTLFRLDQTTGSLTLGEFIPAGMARVSADGRQVETISNAVTETSCYFVATPRRTTMVIGRVVDGDGATPVRQVLVRARGQETFTNGLGEFALPNVGVASVADLITVEVAYQRPNGRIDRVQRGGIAPVPGGVVNLAQAFILPGDGSNRPPAVIAADFITLPESAPPRVTDIRLVAYDPDPGQTITLTLAEPKPNFVTLVNNNNDTFALRFAIGVNLRGDYTLTLKATDNLGATTLQNILVRIFVPGPQDFLAQGVSVRFGPPTPPAPVNMSNAVSVRFGGIVNPTPVNPLGALSVRFGVQSTARQVNPINAVSVLRGASLTNGVDDAAFSETGAERDRVPAFASVSVSKAPVIFSLSAVRLAPGQTVVIAITGANLVGANAIKFIGEDGLPDTSLTATLIAINAEGTALTAAVTANAETKPGRRVVQVTATASSSSLTVSDANVIEVGKRE